MAQRLRALAAPAEILGTTPSTHMAANRGLGSVPAFALTVCARCIDYVLKALLGLAEARTL